MAPISPPIYKQSDIPQVAPEFSLTPTQLSTLSSSSKTAQSTAYCPYSLFRVGCTLLLSNGAYVSGANVENAAYPVGTCAERVAIAKVVTESSATGVEEGQGFTGVWKKGSIKALAVTTSIPYPASPCGMCRQFMREFCELDMPVFMFAGEGDFVVLKLEDLLPMSFGPEALPPR